MIGKTIAHYNIVEKLGEGGMGVVYKAQDTKLGRLVALKFLPPGVVSSPDDVARFEQEAKAISSLNHPNIATIYAVDEADGKKFLVLEFIPGGTLKSKLKKLRAEEKELPIDEAVKYGIQIAEGLASAHRAGITHRDVKSDNAMLTTEGNVKLTDFGLAKLQNAAQLTRAGSTLGTAAYMSPEQMRDEEVDGRSDLFSLGVVLYELTTRRMPFRGEHDAALAYSIVNEEPQPITLFRQNVPDALSTVIAKCLEKDPSKRYHTGDEVAHDLRNLNQESRETVKTVIVKQHAKLPWIIAATLLVFGAIGIYFFMPASRPGRTTSKTIAVLPFNNMSGNPEDEYLSDGMTEDILTQLGKIADLRVISRTTMMRYKGTKKSLREIAKELNAGVVLEGSVRRAADQLRITAQLIDAGSDEHLWAEMYDKEASKIFAIQSDVAQKIAAALQAKLSPSEKERIEKKPTANIEAYNLFLKAREYKARNKKQDNETAIDLLKKAITLDSTFAIAWAGLSSAYSARYGFGSEIFWLDSAVAVSKKALALDGNSAEGYNALANCYYYRGTYDKALEAYRKAVDINPNYFGAVSNIGNTYMNEGKFDEALPWLKKAVALAPTDPIPAQIGYVHMRLGNFVEAERWLMKAIDLQPDYRNANVFLGNVYVLQRKDRQANDLMKKLVATNPDDPRVLDNAGTVAEGTGHFPLAKEYYERSMKANPSFETDPFTVSGIGLGHILLKEGKQNEAHKLLNHGRTLLQKQIEKGDASFYPLQNLASISAIEGKKKEANVWLQKAIDAGMSNYYLAQRDPWLENLRNDEQYKQIMTQFKAKLDAMRKKVEEMEKE